MTFHLPIYVTQEFIVIMVVGKDIVTVVSWVSSAVGGVQCCCCGWGVHVGACSVSQLQDEREVSGQHPAPICKARLRPLSGMLAVFPDACSNR